jgi:hypothetical protein
MDYAQVPTQLMQSEQPPDEVQLDHQPLVQEGSTSVHRLRALAASPGVTGLPYASA